MPPATKKRKLGPPLTADQRQLADENYLTAMKAVSYFLKTNAVEPAYRDYVTDAAITHLIICVRSFDPTRQVTFKTYYLHSVNRRIYSAVYQKWQKHNRDRDVQNALMATKYDDVGLHSENQHPHTEEIENRDYVEHLIKKAELTPKQRRIIEDYMGVKGSNRQRTEWHKNKKLGVSKQAVQAQRARALEKLRKASRKP